MIAHTSGWAEECARWRGTGHMHLYSKRVSRIFRDLSAEEVEGILAWILQAWDSGAVSIHLLMGEKYLLNPKDSEVQIYCGEVRD